MKVQSLTKKLLIGLACAFAMSGAFAQESPSLADVSLASVFEAYDAHDAGDAAPAAGAEAVEGNDDHGGNGAPAGEEEVLIEPEDGEPGDPSEDPVFEIQIGDGKTKTLKQSELLAEASKYHGANKKFEEAAAIRKDAEAKLAELPQREQQLGNVLEHYIRASQAMMTEQQPNWEALLAQDPAQYTRVRHQWEQRQVQLQQAQAIQAELGRRNAEAQAASLQGRLTEERTKLVEAIPAWKDPKVAAEGATAIGKYLVSQGIPEQMVNSMDSAAVTLIARKAMLYDQAMAKQKAAQQGGNRQAPRVERPGAARAATPKSQVERANAGKAFKANPTVDTLASFFE